MRLRGAAQCGRVPPLLFGAWLSLVEHLVRDQGVAGSNPVAPTIFQERPFGEKIVRLAFHLQALARTTENGTVQTGRGGDGTSKLYRCSKVVCARTGSDIRWTGNRRINEHDCGRNRQSRVFPIHREPPTPSDRQVRLRPPRSAHRSWPERRWPPQHGPLVSVKKGMVLNDVVQVGSRHLEDVRV